MAAIKVELKREREEDSSAYEEEEPMETELQENAAALTEDGDEQSKFNFSKKFVCVEYPGIVKNVDKMLETLGGRETISEVFSSATPRRLELKFRPDDIYAKPACGDKSSTLGIVLKIRIKRKKVRTVTPSTSTSTGNIIENLETSISSVKVLGVCDEIFRFENFVDYQYLPVLKDADGILQNVYDDLIPDGPVDLSFLSKPCNFDFLPPPTFSRIDTVDGYKYSMSNKDVASGDKNIIGRTRQPRSGFTKLVTFSDTVPDRPFKGAFTVLKSKMVNDTEVQTLKKLFESRPIWSRHALIYTSKLSHEKLKFLLPVVAFYYTSGPWRVMWVRYGFDPRIDSSARAYQTLDFRVKSNVHLPGHFQRRQFHYSSKTPHPTKKRAVLLAKPGPGAAFRKLKKVHKVINSTFTPGTIPDCKQMMYQYCDLFVPEIQAMLARLPDPGPDSVCNEKTGWLPTGFDERCREILHEEVAKSVNLNSKKDAKKSVETEDSDSDSDDDFLLDDSDDSDNE